MEKQLEENCSYEVVYHAERTTEEGRNWIEEWKEATSLEVPSNCPCCNKSPMEGNYFVGAHVKLLWEMMESKSNQRLFITPTCKKCNSTWKNRKAKEHSFMVKTNYLWEISEE